MRFDRTHERSESCGKGAAGRSVPGRRRAALVLAAGVLFAGAGVCQALGQPKYLYDLSNFTGKIRSDAAKVAVDEASREVYVPDGSQQSIVIFNEQGMELYRFGDDERLGHMIRDIAVHDDGSIYVLAHFYDERGTRIVRCDYRGEPIGSVELRGFSRYFGEFHPNRLILRGGRFYLSSDLEMKAVVAGLDGRVENDWVLSDFADLTEEQVANGGMGGFAADNAGNLYFTLHVTAEAFRVAPDGRVDPFGKRGSGPGKFGIPKGIAVDGRGFVYVVDQLRCKVLIFDETLKFYQEFGTRGWTPGGLIAPQELAVTNSGTVYVSQNARRGVSVFGAQANGGEGEAPSPGKEVKNRQVGRYSRTKTRPGQ